MKTDQLWTILWLRWRLSRNQFTKRGGINAILALIFVAIGLCMGAFGGLAGLLIGAFLMKDTSPMLFLGVWDAIIGAFLFLWIMTLVGEIQRSETIDISKLMHLPVSLKQIFLINYIASHFNMILIWFVPGVTGLILGMTLGRSLWMIFLLPLVFGFVFMITAWTYCLRGWLIRLMVNERRRRAIIASVTLIIILLCQLPNLITNFFARHHWEKPYIKTMEEPDSDRQSISDAKRAEMQKIVILAHEVVPLLWVSNGARSLATGNCLPALLGAGGTILIGWLGIRKAYLSTIRFYEGQANGAVKPLKIKKEKIKPVKKSFYDFNIPGASDESSALAATFLRCLLRAPEIKMALTMNVIMPLVFGGVILFRHPSDIGDIAKTFISTAVIAFTMLGSGRFLFNQFGYDRNGFRTLVLSPVPRQYILSGKNLAIFPVSICIGFLFLVIMTLAFNISVVIFLAAIAQLIAAFLFLCIAGNLISILVPYRIAAGSLKPTKVAPLTTFMLIFANMIFPVVMTPILIGPFLGLIFSRLLNVPGAIVNLFCSVAVLAAAFLFYRLSLNGLGSLLQRREKEILRIVTLEIE